MSATTLVLLTIPNTLPAQEHSIPFVLLVQDFIRIKFTHSPWFSSVAISSPLALYHVIAISCCLFPSDAKPLWQWSRGLDRIRGFGLHDCPPSPDFLFASMLATNNPASAELQHPLHTYKPMFIPCILSPNRREEEQWICASPHTACFVGYNGCVSHYTIQFAPRDHNPHKHTFTTAQSSYVFMHNTIP